MHRMLDRMFFVASVMLVLLVLSCSVQPKQKNLSLVNSTDSLLFDLGTQKQYARMLALTDSFEMEGDLSMLDANRWRGVAYYHQGQYRMAGRFVIRRRSIVR